MQRKKAVKQPLNKMQYNGF